MGISIDGRPELAGGSWKAPTASPGRPRISVWNLGGVSWSGSRERISGSWRGVGTRGRAARAPGEWAIQTGGTDRFVSAFVAFVFGSRRPSYLCGVLMSLGTGGGGRQNTAEIRRAQRGGRRESAGVALCDPARPLRAGEIRPSRTCGGERRQSGGRGGEGCGLCPFRQSCGPPAGHAARRRRFREFARTRNNRAANLHLSVSFEGLLSWG